MPPKAAQSPLKVLAEQSKATSIVAFQQSNWLQQFSADKQEGVCYGLAVGYLLSVRTGLNGQDYIAALDDAAKRKDKSIYEEVSGNAGSAPPKTGVGENFFSLQYADSQRDETFQAAKLQFDSKQRFVSSFENVSQFVSCSPPVYTLVQAPNHTMASACIPDTDRWSFFDPNFGEAVFPDQSHFKQFMFAFFSHRLIQGAYKRSQITSLTDEVILARQKEEQKALCLTAVRFRETIGTSSAG